MLYYHWQTNGQVLVCVRTIQLTNYTDHLFSTGLQHMIEVTGSLILTMALFMQTLSVPQAGRLARLEAEYQVINLLMIIIVKYFSC